MNEPNEQPPADGTPLSEPPPAGPPVEWQAGSPAGPPAAPRRRGVMTAVVAVVALLVGIGGTAAAFLLYEPVMDRLDPPEYTYNVSIFLRADVTGPQREALKTALDGVDVPGGVKYESREEAYENFKRLYEDEPDLVESVRPETLPESFRFETKGTNKDFDCGLLDPVKDLPGIDDIVVHRVSTDDKERPLAEQYCG